MVIKSHYPPALVTLNDVTYAMPGWIVVPTGTTMDEVTKAWVDTSPTVTKKESNDFTKEVLASNGKKSYTVALRNNMWSCTCPGFGFRRKCKHVESVKQTV